jgi:hypothetical protein
MMLSTVDKHHCESDSPIGGRKDGYDLVWKNVELRMMVEEEGVSLCQHRFMSCPSFLRYSIVSTAIEADFARYLGI